MRILIFTSVILLLSSSFIRAQDVSFGIKGGVNFANASQRDINSQSITSFHVGGVMEALYTEKIALQTEIIYSEQGFVYDEDEIERTFNLSYVHVPVMVKYFVHKGVFMEVGPQIGFLNTAKLKTTIEGDTSTRNIKEGLRSSDLSLNAGFGFQLSNGISLNARYNYGVTNIVNGSTDEKFKNRVLQVSVGYMF